MTIIQLTLVVAIFVAVTLIAKNLLSIFAPSLTKKRLDSTIEQTGYASTSEQDTWLQTVIKVASPFAKLSLPKTGWETSPLRLSFMNAGYRNDNVITFYFAAKTVLALGLPALLFILLRISGSSLTQNVTLLLVLFAAAFGYYLPNVILQRLVFYRKREIFESFPDAADLMLVCVESGLGLDSGLTKVAEEMRLTSEALAEELYLMNLEIRAGSTRQKALHNLALRTGVEEVNTFATMLVQADRFGTSIGASLRVFSDEMRTRRRMLAEELAAKIPLKLLFPLAFCVFPSLLLVLLGPAFIQVYRVLLPTLTGQQ